jgi:NADH-quinone oxidoreductase subunit N
MTVAAIPSLSPVLPEIILAVGAMVLLMVGVFRGQKSVDFVSWLACGLLAVDALFVWGFQMKPATTFEGLFAVNAFTTFVKTLILLGSILAIAMSRTYMRQEGIERFEFPVLIVLATLGMLMMVSANDLIALYIGVELQSLALYVIAAIRRDSMRATEAGLKYFVLGALSSGMLLYGASLIYGFTGTTNFTVLSGVVAAGTPSLGLIFGIAFLSAGLAFKVSAVPFHMWTPDVYEGAPTPVTAFFAVAPKVAAIGLFVQAMITAFPGLVDQWRQIIVFLSIMSMVLGAVAAIAQTNIKRLMAYSSIGHVGYALIGLAAGTVEGIQGVLIYLAIYLAMNVGTFVCILSMRRKDGMVEEIADLAGLSRTRPRMALALAIFMFSLAGIPPLAGFFGKWYIFLAAIHAHLYGLAVVGVIASVVGAFYYLRIIKLMYFDEPAEPFEYLGDRVMSGLMFISALVTALFFIYPGPLVASASLAASALFPG